MLKTLHILKCTSSECEKYHVLFKTFPLNELPVCSACWLNLADCHPGREELKRLLTLWGAQSKRGQGTVPSRAPENMAQWSDATETSVSPVTIPVLGCAVRYGSSFDRDQSALSGNYGGSTPSFQPCLMCPPVSATAFLTFMKWQGGRGVTAPFRKGSR